MWCCLPTCPGQWCDYQTWNRLSYLHEHGSQWKSLGICTLQPVGSEPYDRPKWLADRSLVDWDRIYVRMIMELGMAKKCGQTFWIFNLPVKIASSCIESIVSTRHSIWIQHHYHFKDIVFPQIFPLFTLQAKHQKQEISKFSKEKRLIKRSYDAIMTRFITYSVRSSKRPLRTWLPGVSPGWTRDVRNTTGLSFANL